MTEIISTAYGKEHCTCYDVYDRDKNYIAVKLVPDEGYKLLNGGYAISGFALININVINTFDEYSLQRQDKDDELTAEEALAIITGGSVNET